MTSSWVIWRSLLNQKRHLSKPFSEAVKKFGLLVSGGIAFELVPTNVKHFYKRRTSLAEGSVSGSVDCKKKFAISNENKPRSLGDVFSRQFQLKG